MVCTAIPSDKKEKVMVEPLRRICIHWPDGSYENATMLAVESKDNLPPFVSFDPFYMLSGSDISEGEEAFRDLKSTGWDPAYVGLPGGRCCWAHVRARGRWPDVVIRVTPCSPPDLSWLEPPRTGGGWPGSDDY